MIFVFDLEAFRTYLCALLNTARLFKEKNDKSYDVAFTARAGSNTMSVTSSITHQFVQATFHIVSEGDQPVVDFSGLLKATYLQNIVDNLRDYRYVAMTLSQCSNFFQLCGATLQSADLVSESAIELHNKKTQYQLQIKPNDKPAFFDFSYNFDGLSVISINASEAYKFKAQHNLMQLASGSRQPSFALTIDTHNKLEFYSNLARSIVSSQVINSGSDVTTTLSSEGVRLLYELINTFQRDLETQIELRLAEGYVVFSSADFHVRILGLDVSMTPTLQREDHAEGALKVETHLLAQSLKAVEITDDKSFDNVRLRVQESGEMSIRFANGDKVKAETNLSVESLSNEETQCSVSRRMLVTALDFFPDDHSIIISNLGASGRACVMRDDTRDTKVTIPKAYER